MTINVPPQSSVAAKGTQLGGIYLPPLSTKNLQAFYAIYIC